jgi:DNA processing protein
MPRTEASYAWMTFTRAPGLTLPLLEAALERVGSAERLIQAWDADCAAAALPAATREFLTGAAAAPNAQERRWIEAPHHHVLPFCDARFPMLLRRLPDCPLALYVEGRPEALCEPQIAVVGTRNPTAQGRETAFEFAEGLARRGLTITSGLAEGIDTEAHRGALAAEGMTIGVLGSGIDVLYPRSNARLAADIVPRGALISEFPLATPARRGNFPRRNRLIAGLALGTLVVEAARRSGSLITARLAGEQGREVFAVPGSIHSPLARGCHQLIREGAKLTETPDDILSELNFSAFFGASAPAAAGPAPQRRIASGLDKEHKILLDALGFDPADLDVLVVRTGFKPEAVSSMILILELEGHVQAAQGGRYSRVARSL